MCVTSPSVPDYRKAASPPQSEDEVRRRRRYRDVGAGRANPAVVRGIGTSNGGAERENAASIREGGGVDVSAAAVVSGGGQKGLALPPPGMEQTDRQPSRERDGLVVGLDLG